MWFPVSSEMGYSSEAQTTHFRLGLTGNLAKACFFEPPCRALQGGRKKELRTTNVKGAAEYREGGVAYWAFNVKLAITLHCLAAGNVTK